MTARARPFWSSAPGEEVDRSRPRLLLLSHHFPPGHGTGGSRWEKFAPVLVREGWGLDVITLDPSCVPEPDWSRVASLPDHVRLFGARQPRVWAERLESALAAAHRSLKAVLSPREGGPDVDAPADGRAELPGLRSVPVDELPPLWSSPRALLRAFWSWTSYARERAWAREAVACAREVVDPGLHRAVVSTSPPHLGHVAGRTVAEDSAIPLVLDFRDAWKVTEVLPEHLASPLWLRWAEREEPACVAASSLIVANTEPLRRRIAEEYPAAADRTVTVLNGWGRPVEPEAAGPGRFVIAYAGAIYLDRDPRTLMRGVASFLRGRGLGPDEATLEFMGNMRDLGPGLRAMAREEGIEDHLRLHPESPLGEARRFMSGASVLVSLPQSQTLAVPSKIFDYMTFDAWIVAQTRPGSATERLLRDTGADVVAPDDPRALAQTLARRHEEFLRDGRPRPLADACPDLAAEAQAERLVAELDRWRARSGPGRPVRRSAPGGAPGQPPAPAP